MKNDPEHRYLTYIKRLEQSAYGQFAEAHVVCVNNHLSASHERA